MVKLTAEKERIEQTTASIHAISLLLPCRLRPSDTPRQPLDFPPGRLLISVDNDVADRRHLARLDLEVPYIKAVFGINVEEITRIIGLSTALSQLFRSQYLLRVNSALELAMREISTSLDDCQASDAFWCPAQRLLASDEEGKLQLVLGV